jgi:hypothetical protein
MTTEEFIQTLDPRQVEAFRNLPSQQQQAYASGRWLATANRNRHTTTV